MLMAKERELVVEYGKKLLTENLTNGTGGNISIFDKEQGLLAISPSGIGYFETTPEDVVIMNLDGDIVEGDRKPSSEKDLHIEMYKIKPEIGAVVHTHSMYCTVLACLNTPIRSLHYILAAVTTGEVPVAPYVTYGTKELALAAAETIGDSKACLLANHGMLGVGRDIKDAFGVAEKCEWLAEIQWRAMSVGVPALLPEDEMKVVAEKFKTHGQKKKGE